MSVTPYGRLFSVGGFLEYCYSNSYIMTDSTSNDIMLYSDYKNQNIVFGTHQGASSALRITSNEVQFNHNVYVGQSLSIGTSNVRNYATTHSLVLEGPSNSAMGAHVAAYVNGDPTHPVYQQYNNNHDDIAMSFDAYWNGSNWKSSSSNGNFQIQKKGGHLVFHSACNTAPGSPLDSRWHAALSVNSNGFIGVGTINPTHQTCFRGPAGSMLGPHAAYYINEDSNHPIVQQVHWNHDQISYSFDAYWNSNNWVSSSSNGNFQVKKQNGRYMIHSACNAEPGTILDWKWRNAFTVNSNSYIGIGTSNPDHRLTICAEDMSTNGPHCAVYTDADQHPLYQQHNYAHDQITQSFDAYWSSNSWISSHSNGAFQIHKNDASLLFRSACNVAQGATLDAHWRTALAINSNSFVTFGDSNPTHRITVRAEQASMLGPHAAYYVSSDSNCPLYQQMNWDKDDISTSYDSYWDGTGWISGSTSGNFSIQKKSGQLRYFSACNHAYGTPVSWYTALAINSNSYIGIGTSNTTNRLTVRGPSNDVFGPHAAFGFEGLPPTLQICNRNHNNVALNFDSYWDGLVTRSSHATGNFQIKKEAGRLLFQTVTSSFPTSNIETLWKVALTVNSNSYIGINNSNPTLPLDVTGQSLFRSNINTTGHVLPTSNNTVSLGSNGKRFKDLSLGGLGGIDMDGLKLQKEFYSGGLLVYDWVMGEPARVWVKELLVGDPANPLNSNTFLVTASSNGLQLKNVTSNVLPQPYSQLNNMFINTTNVGIGLSNPEKTLHVLGDIELNPYENFTFFWDNLLHRIEQHDILNTLNGARVPSWGQFEASNSPTYYAAGGYNDSPYVQCRHKNSFFVSLSNLYVEAGFYGGFTAMVLARFNRDPGPNETLFSFSNSGHTFEMGRSGTSPEFRFETNDVVMVTGCNVIQQNQWALYTVMHSAGSGMLTVYKNNSNVGEIELPTTGDMYFDQGCTLGNANVDVSSFYLFDRPLFKDELNLLSKKIIYPGHKSLQVRTDARPYPPVDFYDDTYGWNPAGQRDGGQVYQKMVENIYYGNGLYRVWSSTESEPSYQAFDSNYSTGWVGALGAAGSPATLYIEMPFPIRASSYEVASRDIDTQQAPGSWVLYGSTNDSTWMPIDQRNGETAWGPEEKRTYQLFNAVSSKRFKIEINQNGSFSEKFVAISKFVLYGDENSLVADGTGIGIHTSYPKESLTVDGSASISSKLVIGSQDDSLKQNLFEWPPRLLACNVSILDDGEYSVSRSSFYNNNVAFDGFKAFTKTTDDEWVAGALLYEVGGGYTSSTTTLVDDANVAGEWVQLRLPKSIKIHSYRVTPRQSDQDASAPTRFTVAASLDGVAWVGIDVSREKSWANGAEPAVFCVGGERPPYAFYRFIAEAIGESASLHTVVLKDLSFYGSVYSNPCGDPGRLMIYGGLHATSHVVVARKTTVALYEAYAKDLLSVNTDRSVCKNIGPFSSHQFPVFHSKPAPMLYLPQGSYLDAGSTSLTLTNGFTVVAMARFSPGSSKTAILCACDENTEENSVLFGKTDAGQTLTFSIYNGSVQCFSATAPIEDNAWHVYSARYDPRSMAADVFVDRTRSVSSVRDISPIPEDRFLAHAYSGRGTTAAGASTFCISSVLVWNTSLSDEELDYQIDKLYTSASVYVRDDLRVAGAVRGNIEIKSVNTFGTPNYVYPPVPLYDNGCTLSDNHYGNGLYEASASANWVDACALFDAEVSSWQSSLTYGPAYNGNVLSTLADGSYVKGDWVQLVLPTPIVLTYYTFTPRTNDYALSAPKSWCLLGSSGDDAWHNLGNQENVVWEQGGVLAINLTNPHPYQYYRWVFSSSSAPGSPVALQSIKLYGQSSTSMSVKDTSVVVYDRLGINTTSPAAALHVAGFSILSGLKIVPGNASNVTVPSNPGGSINSDGVDTGSIVGYSNEPTGTALCIPGNGSGNAFRFVTGPSSNEVFRITGLGNLGINTAAPTEKLHLNVGNAKFASNAYVMNNLSVGRSNPQEGLHVARSSLFESNITFCNRIRGKKNVIELSNWSMTMQHNDTQVLLATGGGRGIKIDTGTQASISAEPYLSDYYNAAALECYNADYKSLLYVRNDGKVGIGTSNAEQSLSIVGNMSLSNNGGTCVIYSSNSFLGIGRSNPSKTLDVLGDLNFTGNLYKNGTLLPNSPWLQDGATIYYTNKVGINTSNVQETFSVHGTIGISNYGNLVLSTSNSSLGINVKNATESLSIGGGSLSLSNYGKTVVYGSNGNMGIGVVEPRFKLDVNGDLNISGDFYKSGALYVSSKWLGSNNNLFYIDGFVGIGTSSPLSALHVNGNTTLSGHLLPASNSMYDLGSPGKQFRDLYISGTSIHMSNTLISVLDLTGALAIKDSTSGSLQKVVVKELQIGSMDDPLNSNVYVIRIVDGVLSFTNSNAGEQASIIPNIYSCNGFIGILNKAPLYALDVVGDVNLTGTLYNNGAPFSSGQWQEGEHGIYVGTNVGIGGYADPSSALMVTGSVGLSNNLGVARLFGTRSNIGINNSNPAFSLDINGDVNFTGKLYNNSNPFKSSIWDSNENGIYMLSNVGIGTYASLNALSVAGNIDYTGILYNNGAPIQASRWTSNGNGIYVMLGIGIGMEPSSNSLSIVGDAYIDGSVNFTGTLNKNGLPFQTSRWIGNSDGIYVESNVGIGTLVSSNALTVVGDAHVDGSIDFTGTLYNNGSPFQTSRWNSNSIGIYVLSNVGIGGVPLSSNALTVVGNISLDKGLLLRGIQISKNNGGMNNVTQQVFSIPGVSNTSNNLHFYNGLHMNGLRLGAGAPLPPATLVYVQSNLHLSIPTSSATESFKFFAASNEVMRLDGQGRLGIRTSNPLHALDVNGDINFSGMLRSNGLPYVGSQWSNNSTNVFLLSSNVGIGTSTPAYPLDVNGDINFRGMLRSNGLPYVGSQWSNNSTNVFLLSSNVGIGTSTPGYNLHVVGNSFLSNVSACNATLLSLSTLTLNVTSTIAAQNYAIPQKKYVVNTDSRTHTNFTNVTSFNLNVYSGNGFIQTDAFFVQGYDIDRASITIPVSGVYSVMMTIRTNRYALSGTLPYTLKAYIGPFYVGSVDVAGQANVDYNSTIYGVIQLNRGTYTMSGTSTTPTALNLSQAPYNFLSMYLVNQQPF